MTSLDNLNAKDLEIIRECLQATVDGPFFPDWEFQTVFGLEREEVRKVLLRWPAVDEADESVMLAINNSLNNLIGYPLGDKREAWPKYISVTPWDLAVIMDKWKGRASRTAGNRRDYSDDAMWAAAAAQQQEVKRLTISPLPAF